MWMTTEGDVPQDHKPLLEAPERALLARGKVEPTVIEKRQRALLLAGGAAIGVSGAGSDKRQQSLGKNRGADQRHRDPSHHICTESVVTGHWYPSLRMAPRPLSQAESRFVSY